MGQRFMDILMYTILAAMVVLVVMNADKVSQLLATFGGFWLQQTSLLTGSGYNSNTFRGTTAKAA